MRTAKKIIYILTALVTGWFAGLYHAEWLMVLFLAEILFFLLMLAEAVLSARGLSAAPESDVMSFVQRGERASVGFTVTNRGLAGPAHCRCRYLIASPGKKERDFTVSADYRKGNSAVSLLVSADHCGILRVTAAGVQVSDRMDFFRLRGHAAGTVETAIFPEAADLPIPEDILRAARRPDPGALPVNDADDTPDDIRDVREYREGDSFRRIHWNLTARTDDLWVREYQSDAATHIAVICADRTGLEPAGDTRDRWYRLLFSLIRACVRDGEPAVVYPAPGEAAGGRRRIRREEEIRRLFVDLCREAESGTAAEVPAVPLDPAEYRVDASLRLWQGGELIFDYAHEKAER